MAHGAHAHDEALCRKLPLEQPRKRGDNLLDRHPAAVKLRGGLAVTVGHRPPLVVVDPRRAEGEQQRVGPVQRFGAASHRLVHGVEGLVGLRARERAVEVVVEPHPLARAVQLLAADRLGVPQAVERPDDGGGVEENARRVGLDAEPGAGEPRRNVLGKARTEGQQPASVVDVGAEGEGLYFGAELHAAVAF